MLRIGSQSVDSRPGTTRARGLFRSARRGTAIVEFAVVAPLLFMLVFGMIEFGRIIMVMQIMTNAAREGARNGAVGATNNAQIDTVVRNYLRDGAINLAAVQEIKITNENNSAINWTTISSGDYVKVTIRTNAGSLSWLPVSWFVPKNQSLTVASVMRRE